MGDFNEPYGSDPSGTVHIAASCSLVDVLHRRIGSSNFATYSGGRFRIDYVLMSPHAAAAVRHCGYEPPDFRFKDDHRVFFLDFDANRLFGNITPTLVSLASRNIVSKSAELRRYIHAKYDYLKDHRWFQRMALRQQTQSDQNMAESLDRDWLRASLTRKTSVPLARPPLTPQHSPTCGAEKELSGLSFPPSRDIGH
jgi:hypothetical protein